MRLPRAAKWNNTSHRRRNTNNGVQEEKNKCRTVCGPIFVRTCCTVLQGAAGCKTFFPDCTKWQGKFTQSLDGGDSKMRFMPLCPDPQSGVRACGDPIPAATSRSTYGVWRPASQQNRRTLANYSQTLKCKKKWQAYTHVSTLHVLWRSKRTRRKTRHFLRKTVSRWF